MSIVFPIRRVTRQNTLANEFAEHSPRDLAARRRFLSLCLGASGLWHSLGVDSRAVG